jgi:hypothetical protein
VIQGNLVLAEDVSPCRGNPEPPIRGKVQGFSRASRKRMIRDCAKMGKAIPIFVTLTYPAEYPADPSQWKRDLDTWWKRVIRKNPEMSAFWRLEPQERFAPHYHLLIYQKSGKQPFLAKEWIAKSWAKITNGNPAACSRVESLRSHRGGMFYAAKYCAKLPDGEYPDEWGFAGKHWGKLNAKNLPWAKQFEMVLHSHMEQNATLFAMADAYKNAFITASAAKYVKTGMDGSEAYYVACGEWEQAKLENEHLGNTTTFFGTGEDFLSLLSGKLALMDEALAQVTGRSRVRTRLNVDKLLAVS